MKKKFKNVFFLTNLFLPTINPINIQVTLNNLRVTSQRTFHCDEPLHHHNDEVHEFDEAGELSENKSTPFHDENLFHPDNDLHDGQLQQHTGSTEVPSFPIYIKMCTNSSITYVFFFFVFKFMPEVYDSM